MTTTSRLFIAWFATTTLLATTAGGDKITETQPAMSNDLKVVPGTPAGGVRDPSIKPIPAPVVGGVRDPSIKPVPSPALNPQGGVKDPSIRPAHLGTNTRGGIPDDSIRKE